MGDLSEHFSRSEFACHCGCGLGLPDWRLVSALETLRSVVEWPIVVLSGLRCPAHNKAVGGAANSQHLLGTAADIRVDGLPLSQLFLRAAGVLEFHQGGIGLYPDQGFVHVDVRSGKSRWGQIGNARVRFLDAWDYTRQREGLA